MPEPEPAYSLPVAAAAANCPRCERPFRFEIRRAPAPDLDGRPLRCACGQVLGRYVARAAGMIWLELACRPALDSPAA